jgi:hypothetical protein
MIKKFLAGLLPVLLIQQNFTWFRDSVIEVVEICSGSKLSHDGFTFLTIYLGIIYVIIILKKL